MWIPRRSSACSEKHARSECGGHHGSFDRSEQGFGFVEMSSNAEAQAAIAALGGKEHGGRTLTVNPAKPREERSGGSAAAVVVAVAAAGIASSR
jgi:RNA recognition motif-containing protein